MPNKEPILPQVIPGQVFEKLETIQMLDEHHELVRFLAPLKTSHQLPERLYNEFEKRFAVRNNQTTTVFNFLCYLDREILKLKARNTLQAKLDTSKLLDSAVHASFKALPKAQTVADQNNDYDPVLLEIARLDARELYAYSPEHPLVAAPYVGSNGVQLHLVNSSGSVIITSGNVIGEDVDDVVWEYGEALASVIAELHREYDNIFFTCYFYARCIQTLNS